MFISRSSTTAKRRLVRMVRALLRFASPISGGRSISILEYIAVLRIGRVIWWWGGWIRTR